MKGDGRGRRCSVCDDARVRAITRDLLEGLGARAVAAKYPPLTKSSVGRHLAHIPTSLRALSDLEKQTAADALTVALPVLNQMRRLTARLMAILDRAEARGDDGTAIATHRELRRHVELLARLTGELDPRAVGETGGPLTVVIQYVDKLALMEPAPAPLPAIDATAEAT